MVVLVFEWEGPAELAEQPIRSSANSASSAFQNQDGRGAALPQIQKVIETSEMRLLD